MRIRFGRSLSSEKALVALQLLFAMRAIREYLIDEPNEDIEDEWISDVVRAIHPEALQR